VKYYTQSYYMTLGDFRTQWMGCCHYTF